MILIFLMLILQVSVFAAGTPAGETITTEGTVKAVGPDNAERVLKRGGAFYALETIVVAAASKAQLKFSDGGLVNLIPSTEFRIDSYSFKDSSGADHSLTSLAKGGFRSISGSIAQENPSSVSVQTPVATIGLRGTVLEVNIVGGKLFCGCTQGRVQVSNSKGSVVIGEGGDKYATVPQNAQPASQQTQPSALAPTNFTPPAGAINFGGTAAPGAPTAPGQMQVAPTEGLQCRN